jgi:hypothetical protein
MLGDGNREQRLRYVDFCRNEGQGAGMFNPVRNSRVSPVPDKRQGVDRSLVELPTMLSPPFKVEAKLYSTCLFPAVSGFPSVNILQPGATSSQGSTQETYRIVGATLGWMGADQDAGGWTQCGFLSQRGPRCRNVQSCTKFQGFSGS